MTILGSNLHPVTGFGRNLLRFAEITGIAKISVMTFSAKPVAGKCCVISPKFEVQGCSVLLLFWNDVKRALNQSLVQLVLQ